MEGFIIRGWDPIIFHLPRVALTPRTLAISNQAAGLGVPHRAARYRPRRPPVFVPGGLELQVYGTISDPGMGPYPPTVALTPRTLANQLVE